MIVSGISIQRKVQENLKISSSTFAKMGRGGPISMDVLIRLCEYLDCNIGDIVSFVKDNEA